MKATELILKLKVGGETRSLDQELYINQEDIFEELASQPSWFAYYASLQVESSIFYDQAKGEYEKMEAEVSAEIRGKYKTTGLKVTEKQIETETIMDSRIQALRKKVLNLKRSSELMKVATRAFEQRLQALMSICAMERQQLRSLDPQPRESLSKQQEDYRVPARKELSEELKRLRISQEEFNNSIDDEKF